MTQHRYALVNRPPMVGGLPSKLSYQVEPRPSVGAPHHAMARHGILVTERELEPAELITFELAPIIDGDDLAPLVERVVAEMRELAAEYVQAQEEDPAAFSQWALAAVSRAGGGVSYSIGDPERLVAEVLQQLQSIARDAEILRSRCRS